MIGGYYDPMEGLGGGFEPAASQHFQVVAPIGIGVSDKLRNLAPIVTLNDSKVCLNPPSAPK